jgi:hypothetical protein
MLDGDRIETFLEPLDVGPIEMLRSELVKLVSPKLFADSSRLDVVSSDGCGVTRSA